LFAQKLTIYTEEFPPYNFTEDNEIVGVSTEVVETVMKEAGLDYEIVSYPWARTYKYAKERSNALIFTISRRAKREAYFKWIGIIVPSKHSVFALKSRTDIKIEKIDDMKKYKIGTTIGDARETYLLTNGFEISELQRVGGDDANRRNYQKLKLGRIDIWPMSEANAHYTLRQVGDDPDIEIRKVFLLEEMSKGGYYIASGLQTSDEIVKKIRLALQKFKKTREYRRILEKWGLGASFVAD
jgi:polar amino acid transport system substrate-binding protein